MIYLIYLICGAVFSYFSLEFLREAILENPRAKDFSQPQQRTTLMISLITMTLLWGVFLVVALLSAILEWVKKL